MVKNGHGTAEFPRNEGSSGSVCIMASINRGRPRARWMFSTAPGVRVFVVEQSVRNALGSNLNVDLKIGSWHDLCDSSEADISATRILSNPSSKNIGCLCFLSHETMSFLFDLAVDSNARAFIQQCNCLEDLLLRVRHFLPESIIQHLSILNKTPKFPWKGNRLDSSRHRSLRRVYCPATFHTFHQGVCASPDDAITESKLSRAGKWSRSAFPKWSYTRALRHSRSRSMVFMHLKAA